MSPPAASEVVVRALAATADDVALGAMLVREYTVFTWEEAIAAGVEGMPDSVAGLEVIIPDAADFGGVYGRPGTAFLVAEQPGVGVLGGVGIQRYDAERAEMKRLWVRPAGRGAGTGRLLATASIDHAAALGYREIVLDVVPYRTRAIALYRSLGFTPRPPIHPYPFAMVAFGLTLT